MNLFKTSILSFIATSIKMAAGLIINKVISILIGPSGLALIGQFQNSQGLLRVIAQGGINSGVTKYTAEYAGDLDKIKLVWSNSVRITLVSSLFVSVILFVFSNQLSYYIFDNSNYGYIFTIFSMTITLFSFNQLLLSILNGLKEIRMYIYINIIQSIVGLILTVALVYLYRLDGALVALVTNQSIVIFVLIWKLRNHSRIIIKNFISQFNFSESKKLLNYTLMTLASTLAVPLSMLVIRNYVGENISWDAAGYWQAMVYVSSTYMLVVTTALSTYYLPRLSEISNKIELKRELKTGFIILIPFMILISALVYILRDWIVWILFTPDFKPMLVLFKWQLLGNVMKMSSWLISYLMLSKSLTKEFIISEIIFSITYTALCIYFVNTLGLEGLSFAYFINYIIYFLVMFFWMRRIINGKFN